MITKDTPAWVGLGGFTLAGAAGMINAVGFLGVHHQAITHLSGTVTILSTEVARLDWLSALQALFVVVAFFLGCVLSGFIIQQSTLRLGRRYGVALLIESALLTSATYFLVRGDITGDYLASMACGLQNAMATSYSGAVIRTTHMTGIVTDLGLACGHLLRGKTVDGFRLRLLGSLLAGFSLGGVLGALGYSWFSYYTLLLPAALSGSAGLVYAVIKQLERRKHRRAPSPPPRPRA